jgi:GNAT superfamily N-acetyltransferase
LRRGGCDAAAMHVRIATPSDAAAIGSILGASYPVLMRGAYAEDLLARALPRIVRPNPALLASGTYYLAEAEGGEAAGCGGWSARPPDNDSGETGTAHIRHFATHPTWIGRGVGRAIYQCCEDVAREAGFVRFVCYASLNGEGFYAAMGFRRLHRIEVPMGRNLAFPSILMIRDIGAAS